MNHTQSSRDAAFLSLPPCWDGLLGDGCYLPVTHAPVCNSKETHWVTILDLRAIAFCARLMAPWDASVFIHIVPERVWRTSSRRRILARPARIRLERGWESPRIYRDVFTKCEHPVASGCGRSQMLESMVWDDMAVYTTYAHSLHFEIMSVVHIEPHFGVM